MDEPSDEQIREEAAHAAAAMGRSGTSLLNEARDWLRAEGLGASPTELCYGLAAVTDFPGMPTLAEHRLNVDVETERLGRLAARMRR